MFSIYIEVCLPQYSIIWPLQSATIPQYPDHTYRQYSSQSMSPSGAVTLLSPVSRFTLCWVGLQLEIITIRGVGLGWDTLSGTGAITNTVRRLFDRIWKNWQSVCSVACLFVGSYHRSSVRPTEPSLQVGPKEPLDF